MSMLVSRRAKLPPQATAVLATDLKDLDANGI